MSLPDDRVEQSRHAVLRAFLLCDIRGYSTFAAVRGDEATGALTRRFSDLASEVLPSHGGEIIGLRGDEVLAAFESARSAVRASVAFQARLLDATREDPSLPLPAGIGLDFGEAIVSPEGWSANAINVAARLCSIAAAGEILATNELVHIAQTMDGIRAEKRASVAVKGIPRPVGHVRLVGTDTDSGAEFRTLGIAQAAEPPAAPAGRRGKVIALAAAGVVAVAAAASVVVWTSRTPGATTPIGTNAVGQFSTRTAALHRRVAIGANPTAVAADASAVWVVNTGENTVSRIDERDRTAPANTIVVGQQPSAVALGFGAVWVTNEADRSVSRVNAGSPPRVGDTIGVGNGPASVVTGFDRVWVANRVDDTISVIDPQGSKNQVADRVLTTVHVAAEPDALAAGFGSVWVANGGSSSVFRIDPATEVVSAAINVGNDPSALAVDAHGVWVANSLDDTVSLIDPSTNSVTATVHVGHDPRALASDGAHVWVANSNSDTVTELDAASARIVRTLQVGNAPQGIAVVGNDVWVAAGASSLQHRGGTLRIVENDAMRTLDPAVAYATFAWNVLATTNDGLVTYRRTAGPDGAAIVPDLATRLPTQSSDGLTYTFELRKGIRYSTGAEVRPSDFRASLERAFRIAKMPPYYGAIVGADACMDKPKTCDLTRGIVADDTTGTIIVKLAHPDPDLLYKLALPFAAVLPANTPASDLGYAPHPATGPYQISSASPTSITLTRNPSFALWSPQAQPDGYPDRVDITVNPKDNPDAADQDATAVAAGVYDWTPDFASPRYLNELVQTRTGQMHAYSDNSVHYFFLNTTLAPFNDVRVRRAVNLAVDRVAAVKALGGSLLHTPTCQLVAPSLFGHRPYCPYTVNPNASGGWTGPDLAAARALVRAAHAEGAHVTVLVPQEEPQSADVMVRALRSLGFSATARVHDKPGDAYYEYIGDPRNHVQTALEGWTVDYPEPSNLFVPLLRCEDRTMQGNLDESMFCDHDIDAAMDDALRLQTTDPAAAGVMWASIDRRIDDLAPWVPLTNARRYDVVSPRVGNYQHHPEYGMLLDQVWVQ